MRCTYCYYTDKSRLYKKPGHSLMTEETLDLFTRRYIESQTSGAVQFTWHGGEATMRPLDFYRKAVELQQRYGKGREISNCLQTNGLLLNDEWCTFLHDNGWLVGLSIDGPRDFHDEYRLTKTGQPSFMRVMKAIRLLQKHRVEWNAMAVVNDYNADFPVEFYRFFKSVGCRYIQFSPIVERITDGVIASVGETGEMAPFSVTPQQWGDFLIGVFDEWVKTDVGSVFVQLFDCTLANWVGEMPGLCSMAPVCGHAAVMEHDGEVYSCDHFVFPEYHLGNIHDHTFIEMMMSDKQRAFGAAKRDSLTRQCRECQYLFACHGECPKNRIGVSRYGEPGQNYLCEGYRRFFEHVAPYMDFMRAELAAGRPPANVMRFRP